MSETEVEATRLMSVFFLFFYYMLQNLKGTDGTYRLFPLSLVVARYVSFSSRDMASHTSPRLLKENY
jgi:hypothetical protein